MALKLGMTGMDGQTQAALATAFNEVNAAIGKPFELTQGNDADFVIVDMDSLYGPMSFMQLHNAGKHVIGLTQGTTTKADSRLARPLDLEQFKAVLTATASGAPVPAPIAAPVAAPAPAPVAAAASGLSGVTPAPSPADVLPEEKIVATHAQAPAQPSAPVTAAANVSPEPVVAPAALADPEPEPVAVPVPEAPRTRTLLNWLEAGALTKTSVLSRDGLPELIIDPGKREYRGPATLKSLVPYFDGEVSDSDFRPAADEDLVRTAGSAQPLQRLVWLAGLTAGKGKLETGVGERADYLLTKWPQTEREFPKHFRIATAMMKGPSHIMEIADAAGVPLEDVADFINANVATGFAAASLNGAPVELTGPLAKLRPQ